MIEQELMLLARTAWDSGDAPVDWETRTGRTPVSAPTTTNGAGRTLKHELYVSAIDMSGIAFPMPTALPFAVTRTATQALAGVPFTLNASIVGIPNIRPRIILDGAVLVGQQYVLTKPNGTYYFNGENTGIFVANPSWTNTLGIGESETETATYTATALGATDTGSISITVTGEQAVADQGPVIGLALPALNGTEDTAFSYTAPVGVFTDPEGDAFTYVWTNENGDDLEEWLTSNGLTVSGTPPLNFNGVVNLRLTGTANGKSVFQETTLTIAPVDDLVTGTPPVLTTNNAPKVVRYSTVLTDADGDPIQPVSVVVQNGASEYTTSIGAGPNYDVTFTPDAGFSGQTYADVTFSDGAVIRQQLVNLEADAPVVVDQTFNQNEDTLAAMDVSGSVTYGSGQSFVALTLLPASGLLVERTAGPVVIDGVTFNVSGQTIVPSAAANFFGTVQVGYVFEQTDGKLGSGVLTLEIASVNDPVTWTHGDSSTPIVIGLIEDVDTQVNLRPYFSDVDSLQASRFHTSVNGTALVSNAFVTVDGWGFRRDTNKNVTVRPPLNYNRDISPAPVFAVVVSDPEGSNGTGYFQFDVAPTPDAPTIAGNPASVDLIAGQGTGVIQLTGTSVDNAILSWIAVSSDTNAVVATIPSGGIDSGTSIVSLQINAVSGAATGSHTVTVTLVDNAGQETEVVIVVNVTEASTTVGTDPTLSGYVMQHEDVQLRNNMSYNNYDIYAIASGSFFNPANWSLGRLPLSNEYALIPENINMMLDQYSTTLFGRVRVDGFLDHSTIFDSRLAVDTLWISPAGRYRCGDLATPMPIERRARIDIRDGLGKIDGVLDPWRITRGIIFSGRRDVVSAFDTTKKVSETATVGGVLAGATSVTLKAGGNHTSWPAGVEFPVIFPGTNAYTETVVGSNRTSLTTNEEIRYCIRTGDVIDWSADNRPPGGPGLLFDHVGDTKMSPVDGAVELYGAPVEAFTENIIFESLYRGSDIRQRGHVMHLHARTGEYRGAVHIEMGRTDHNEWTGTTSSTATVILTSDAAGLAAARADPNADPNLPGRYSNHDHHGFSPTEYWGVLLIGDYSDGRGGMASPGWAFVQHKGYDVSVFYCTVVKGRGGGFFSEDGDESGLWFRCNVMGSLGRRFTQKSFGVSGAAFNLHGRTILLIECNAFQTPMYSHWSTRGSAWATNYAVDPYAARVDNPLVIAWPTPTQKSQYFLPALRDIRGHAWGCAIGSVQYDACIAIARDNSDQATQVPSYIDGFRATRCGKVGIFLSYLGNYAFTDIVIGGIAANLSDGSSAGAIIAQAANKGFWNCVHFENFTDGIRNSNDFDSSSSLADRAHHFVSDRITFTNVTREFAWTAPSSGEAPQFYATKNVDGTARQTARISVTSKALPQDGDYFEFDGTRYTFRDAPSVAYDLPIGVNIGEAMTNLKDAINGDLVGTPANPNFTCADGSNAFRKWVIANTTDRLVGEAYDVDINGGNYTRLDQYRSERYDGLFYYEETIAGPVDIEAPVQSVQIAPMDMTNNGFANRTVLGTYVDAAGITREYIEAANVKGQPFRLNMEEAYVIATTTEAQAAALQADFVTALAYERANWGWQYWIHPITGETHKIVIGHAEIGNPHGRLSTVRKVDVIYILDPDTEGYPWYADLDPAGLYPPRTRNGSTFYDQAMPLYDISGVSYLYAAPSFTTVTEELSITGLIVPSLRKAVDAYSGPLIRVRDTNDNSEQDCTFDANGDLIAPVGIVGEPRVTTIYDQSGNGNHLTQTDPAKMGLLVMNGSANGKPVIRMLTREQFYKTTLTEGSGQPLSVFQPTNPVWLMTVACPGNTLSGEVVQIPQQESNPANGARFGLARDNDDVSIFSRFATSADGVVSSAKNAGAGIGTTFTAVLDYTSSPARTYFDGSEITAMQVALTGAIDYGGSRNLHINRGLGGADNEVDFSELIVISAGGSAQLAADYHTNANAYW